MLYKTFPSQLITGIYNRIVFRVQDKLGIVKKKMAIQKLHHVETFSKEDNNKQRFVAKSVSPVTARLAREHMCREGRDC